METYDNEGEGNLVGGCAGTLALLVLSAVLVPVFMPQRTRGASTSAFLDRNQRPILLELKNCRVVTPAAGAAAPRTERAVAVDPADAGPR